MKETTVPKEQRKKYDPTFKREAVALWLKSGKAARQVAQELGVPEPMLYRWKQIYRPDRDASQLELQDQIKKLQRENELLREQRDILKKTLGIISEPPPNAINGSKP
jgi:transposase